MTSIYRFSQGKAHGSKKDIVLLGGKGANLAEMCNIGLPIPPGLTIPTTECVKYLGKNEAGQAEMMSKLAAEVAEEVVALGPEFGYRPLVSVRSGARVSMPGMMDTVLNLGLTPDNIDEYREHLGAKCALDSYRRLIQMYGNVVYGLPTELFEAVLANVMSNKYGLKAAPTCEAEMSVKHLEKLVEMYLTTYEANIGEAFPDSLYKQLYGAIGAVFDSWNSDRAIKYRAVHNIPNDWGTAVNVQAMVFGNMNDNSASGVLFTRDPDSGENKLYAEYLINAQGEDVVAGVRTPEKLETMPDHGPKWAKIHKTILEYATKAEVHYRDMQDMEFTVQDGKVWMLQTRNGKRSARAAFKIAYDLANDGLITKAEAVSRVSGKQYLVLGKPMIDPEFKTEPDLVGIPAAGHLVTGEAVLSSADAEVFDGDCILVTEETTPEDFGGMMNSVGILTRTGGATSHAAVVARGMDKTCVVGATELDGQIKAGMKVTLDGATGRVWIDTEVPVITQVIEDHVKEMIKWGSENADPDAILRVTPKVSNSKDAELVKAELAEQVPQEGRVYIDITNLLWGKETKYVLSKLLQIAKGRKGLSGIIGIPNEKLPHEDVEFLSYLGLDEGTAMIEDKVSLNDLLVGLGNKQWSKTLKSRWTIHLPPYATETHYKVVDGHGWMLVRTVRNLKELIEVNGIMDIDPMLETKLMAENVDIKEFFKLLKDAGRKADHMPRAVTENRMIFEVFKFAEAGTA